MEARIYEIYLRVSASIYIQGNSDDSRKLLKCAKSLFNQEADLTFPGYNDKTKLASDIGKFFAQKIERIRTALDTAASNPLSNSDRTNIHIMSYSADFLHRSE